MRWGLLTLGLSACTWTLDLECEACPDSLLCRPNGTCPQTCREDDDCVDGTSCADGTCVPGCTYDEDLDGVCDRNDVCADGDDHQDQDADGTPDACDDCVGAEGHVDEDADGTCDADDACPGSDDNADDDADGVPDGCDDCDGPGASDADGDEVCDEEDVCPSVDDRIDYDGNDIPDCFQDDVEFYPFASITGWEGNGVYSTTDATGVSGTGSLQLPATTTISFALGPCVRVTPGERYRFGAMLKTAGGVPPFVLGVEKYADAACNAYVDTAGSPDLNPTTWRSYTYTFNATPFEDSRSIVAVRFLLVANDGPIQQARLDDAMIGPFGTRRSSDRPAVRVQGRW